MLYSLTSQVESQILLYLREPHSISIADTPALSRRVLHFAVTDVS